MPIGDISQNALIGVNVERLLQNERFVEERAIRGQTRVCECQAIAE
jgi:hypothetical protein